jgi:hypothetical protein
LLYCNAHKLFYPLVKLLEHDAPLFRFCLRAYNVWAQYGLGSFGLLYQKLSAKARRRRPDKA